MKLNKVLSIKDYPELVGSDPPIRRKQWEVAMAMATLDNHANLNVRHTEVLGAGAGHEETIYRLSNKVKRVFATDLYVQPGIWGREAPSVMLSDPGKLAKDGVEFDEQRIVTQHMDMLNLRYPDNTFHAAFSSGSIEHVGSFDDVAQAASELGRVLRPGGVLSLATEWKVRGEGWGWDNVLLFDTERLNKYIIEPSGLKPIDELEIELDDETLAQVWPLRTIVDTGRRPQVEAVLEHGGYLFTSVHIALRKPK